MSSPESTPEASPLASRHASSRERRSPVLPEPAETSERPEGATFRLTFSGGRKGLIDLSKLTRPGLATQTAQIIWTDSSDLVAYQSKSTAEGACRAMLRFGEFLDESSSSHVSDLADVTTRDVDAFEAWIHERYPDKASGAPYAYVADLVRLLGRSVDLGLASPSLADRCRYVSADYARPSTQPRDAYDEFTMNGLREAARRDVSRIVERLRAGRRIAAAAGLAGEATFHTAGGVMRVLYSTGLGGAEAYGEICALHAKTRPSGPQLVDMAYLKIADIVPFVILLMDDTTLPPECIQDLRADCLVDRQPAAGRTTMRYQKRRRFKDDRTFRHQVRTDREFSAGWLINVVLELTENARRGLNLASDEGSLFLARWGGKAASTRAHLPAVAAWLARNPIPVDNRGGTLDRLVLSRIRKTSKVRDFVAAGGNLKRIGSDHSVGTFVGRYATVPAEHERYEAIAVEGIQAALDSATRPRVLHGESEARLATDPVGAASSLVITERQARDLASGAADAWVAGCLGAGSVPPVNGAGLPCGAPIWGCLDCQNAVFTTSRLPHLLRLLGHVTAQRMRMDVVDWRRVYGFAYARTMQIVDKFPPAIVRAAMDEVAADATPDWTIALLTHRSAP